MNSTYLSEADIKGKMLLRIVDMEDNEHLFYMINKRVGATSGQVILEGYYVGKIPGGKLEKKEFFLSSPQKFPFKNEKVKGYIIATTQETAEFQNYLKGTLINKRH